MDRPVLVLPGAVTLGVDFGLGVAQCGDCGRGPILNRGCGECSTRLCQRCTESHKCECCLICSSAFPMSRLVHIAPHGPGNLRCGPWPMCLECSDRLGREELACPVCKSHLGPLRRALVEKRQLVDLGVAGVHCRACKFQNANPNQHHSHLHTCTESSDVKAIRQEGMRGMQCSERCTYWHGHGQPRDRIESYFF